MTLYVIGMNHTSASIEVRESVAISSVRLRETLRSLKEGTGILEAVLLSTCNRLEAYLCAPEISATRSVFAKLFHPTPVLEITSPCPYEFTDASAARHLFRVVSGLDSMVIGENEILGQVKQAYYEAHAAGTTGKLLNVLFQRGLYIGKRVRTETGLSRGAASIGSLAVTLAERIFGSLEDRRVMILGAGEMAEVTAKHLLRREARSVIVSNRTFERACALAQQFGGTAMRFEDGLRHMAQVDIVVCSTSAPHPIVHPQRVREIMVQRRGRSLVFIDLAVPRDVHPEVRGIDGVYLYNLDDLQAVVDENQTHRKKEIWAAEQIIEEKTEEFKRWLEALREGCNHSLRHFSPIAAMRQSNGCLQQF